MQTKDRNAAHGRDAPPGKGTPKADNEASKHLKGSAGADPKTSTGQHAQSTQQSAGANRNQQK